MHLRDCDFKVFRFHYKFNRQIRTQIDASGDTERVGWEPTEATTLIVAPDEKLARALFEWGRPNTIASLNMGIIKVELLGNVEYMIRG